MSNKTGISWTDATWNPVRGCSRVSEGCRHCYAETMAVRIVRMGKGKPTPYDGLVNGAAHINAARWTGKVVLDAAKLAAPLGWRKPRRIFVNSMSDLFHESLTNEQIAAVFGVMAAAPRHTFQCLTKRSARMREWFAWAAEQGDDLMVHAGAPPDGVGAPAAACAIILDKFGEDCGDVLTRDQERVAMNAAWPLPNVWLGVSVENQAAADDRIPDLLATPAAVRFLSCEPLIGPLDLENVRHSFGHSPSGESYEVASCLEGDDGFGLNAARNRIDWLIAGCESGPGARPCDAEWLRSLRDQCVAAGTAFFLKQAAETKSTCPHCGGRDIATIPGYGSLAMWTCRCSPPSPGHIPAVAQGDGSRRKPGGVIELPYLDGVQHAAFPEVKP